VKIDITSVPEVLELFEGPISIAVGSSSAQRRPHFTRAMGIRLGDAPDEVVLLLPKVASAQLLADVTDNPILACTIAHMGTFETRQFIGRVDGVSDATDEDVTRADSTRAKAAELLGQFFGPSTGAGWLRYVARPAVAVRLRVEYVYDQTPGSRAGARLS
jgi:hypothetical protein